MVSTENVYDNKGLDNISIIYVVVSCTHSSTFQCLNNKSSKSLALCLFNELINPDASLQRSETQRSNQVGDYSQLRTFFLTCFHSYASICATFKVIIN